MKMMKMIEKVLNTLAVALLSFVLLTVVVGMIAYFRNPTSELAGALAGVLAPLTLVALCILGVVFIAGRRRTTCVCREDGNHDHCPDHPT